MRVVFTTSMYQGTRKVESCEITGAHGKEAEDLVSFIVGKESPATTGSYTPTYTGISPELLREAVDAVYVRGNNKIPCIKLVRILTGWGLKESKEFVDGLPTPVRTYA